MEPLEDVYDRGREMVLGRPGRGISSLALMMMFCMYIYILYIYVCVCHIFWPAALFNIVMS